MGKASFKRLMSKFSSIIVENNTDRVILLEFIRAFCNAIRVAYGMNPAAIESNTTQDNIAENKPRDDIQAAIPQSTATSKRDNIPQAQEEIDEWY
jgi:hypothetical protein